MVKIKVIVVGKTREGWIKEGILHYQKLLKKYVELNLVEIREEKITKSRDTEIILDAEAKRILRYVNKSSHVDPSDLRIALDAKGKSLSSEDFARLLEENLSRGYSEFVFILGGALGLSLRVLDACPIKLSLSQMTFTHEMSRLILLEQIYRAFSILKGTGYHK
ncbi:MAG: 23S rRNA (pseudouridine(1915)-N(3))-methyltransferase RlmH [candidate division Zixibacteria bacterium]|nr:23S rRNA (pseudouridine(1915)-N(3))-methyltransferase RlmH [candidate division Zixibacteria bacterium]